MVYQRLATAPTTDVLGHLAASQQTEHKKQPVGVLAFNSINKGWLLTQELSTIKDESLMCSILACVLEGLAVLHGMGLTYLNIHPDNVMKSTAEGKYCLLNMQRVIEDGISNQQFQQNPLVKGTCDTDFRYASPEMLDLYSKRPIDWRADIFCLGCLAYELQYKKYPYGTPLAVINLSPTAPQKEEHNIITKLIQQCLVPYQRRKPARELSEWMVSELAAKQAEKAKKSSIVDTQATFADRFKDALTKMTKESESWIISYTEEGETEPDIKFVDQLLKKVYRNNSKLQKIYSIICRRASHKLQCPTSCLKLLTLMWNLIRRGPYCCNSSEDKSNFREAANLIRSYYKKTSPDGLLVEVCKLFAHKQELTDQLKGIFEGNFHFTSVDKIESVTPILLQKQLGYLQDLVSSFQKITGSPQWKCADTLAKPVILDEIYDLSGQLIVLLTCLLKDIDLKRRKIEGLKQCEVTLESCLKRIKGFGGLPKLHLVTSLEGSLSRYKDAIDFEVVEGVKRSCYELFYKTGKTYCGISMPISYSVQFIGNTAQGKKDDRKSPKSTKIVPIDQPVSDGDEDINFEAKQIRDCQNIISHKQSTESPKRSPKKTPVSMKEIDDIFAQWGGKQQIKKEVVEEPPKGKSFADIFADFGNVTQPPVKKEAEKELDFDMLWKGGSGSGSNNGSGSGGLAQNKAGIVSTPSPVIKKEDMQGPSTNNRSFSSKEDTTSSSGNNNSGNAGNVLVQNSSDLMFFTNNVAAKETTNVDIFDFTREPKSSKAPELEALQKEIMQSLKNEDLKKLILTSSIVVLWQSVKLDKVIGCGSAGEVYLGSYNSKQAAVKKVKSLQQNPSAFKEFEREVVTLIRIGQHPNLVSLLGITKQGEDFYLLMDYCQGGNLFELLHRRIDLLLPWKERVSMARQIAQAMNYLHSGCGNPIIHRDLKSLNILVENKIGSALTEPIRVKVTDFGLSRNPDAQFMTSALGTLVNSSLMQHWMAPELLLNKNYSGKIDVYSFGVVLWEICCRTTPYKDFKLPLQIMQHVTAQNGRPDMRCINEGCPEELRSLIRTCLSSDEHKRPTFPALIEELSQLQSRY